MVIPERPWQKAALDLYLTFGTEKWITIRISLIFLNSLKLQNLLLLNEMIFSYGICERVRSDNDPQFRNEFQSFAKEYDFELTTSSSFSLSLTAALRMP